MSSNKSKKKLEKYEYVKFLYHFLFLCGDIASDLLFCYQLYDAKESEARTIFWVLVGVICFSSCTYSLYFVYYVYITFYDYSFDDQPFLLLCLMFGIVFILAPFGQVLPVASVCIAFYLLHMREDIQISGELTLPFYLELFSETILQSFIQFYVLISFSKVSTVQYVSFTISLVNLCSKLWDIFSVSQDEKWQIIMLAVGTWLSVDVLLEFTNLWAFMNLTSGSYHLLGFEHMTIWTMLYYVKVGIIYILMFFFACCCAIKDSPENIGLYFCIFFVFLLLAILLSPLAFTSILVLKFSLIVPVLTLSVLWFKVRYYQLQQKVEKSTEKKLPFLFLVRYSLQSFLPNNRDKSPSTLFIELYMSKVYQRPNSEGYLTANSKITLSHISDKEEKIYFECILNVLFRVTLVFLGIAYVIQVGSGIYSLFHLVNALLKGVDPQSVWYVGSLTSMLVVSLVIGVLFTKIMQQKIPKFANLDEDNLAEIIHFLKCIDQIQIWKKDFETMCNSNKMLSFEKVTELTLKNTITISLPEGDFQSKCNDKNTTTTSTINFTTDVKESKWNDKNTTTTTTNFTTDVKEEFTEKEYIMWKVDQEQWGAIDCCTQCGDTTQKCLNRCYGCRCCFCDRCYHAFHNKMQGREEHERKNVTDAINPWKFKEENKYNWVILATEDRKFNNQNPFRFFKKDY